MSSLRVVFAGTPDFALASLRALVAAGVRPVAVLTRPDRPAGRGRSLAPGPVRRFAVAEKLEVLQPASLKGPGILDEIGAFAPDVMVVAAYGLLLPQALLDIPRCGAVNVHASLLPRWRGAAPIQAAILAGDSATGVCLMRMEEGLDSGPVYASAAVPLDGSVTAGEIHDRLAELGGKLLAERLGDVVAGRLEAVPQDESLATYAPKIRSADAVLDWREPAKLLHRKVRAFNPVPGARFHLNDEMIKCWRAEPGQVDAHPAGRVLAATTDGIEVACGEGSLRLLELQRPGRTRVTAAEFSKQLDLADRRFE